MSIEDYTAEIETAPAIEATVGPENFGSYAEATCEVDENTNYARLTIPLRHGVRLIHELPVPLLAAWSTDNIAGKLLAESGKLKA